MQENKSCEFCKFFYEKRCRRYPPQVYGCVDGDQYDITTSDISIFPEVKKTDWCGEFKSRNLNSLDYEKSSMQLM